MNYLQLLLGSYLALVGQLQSPMDTVHWNESEWQSFKLQHGKSYENSAIEMMRRSIYALNKQRVEEFNANQSEEQTFSLKLNHLADWTDEERKILNGFKLPDEMEARRLHLTNTPEAQQFLDDILNDQTIEVPDEVDWRRVAGRVGPVRNQGRCGSCWAFGTVGVLEGQETVRHLRRSGRHSSPTKANGTLVQLSVQNLVDCVEMYYGCVGGDVPGSLAYVHTEGIEAEQSYPYEAKDGGHCRFNKSKVVFKDKGYAVLPMGDENTLKQVVAKFGPVAVSIDAGHSQFFNYHRGVYYVKDCFTADKDLDHVVLVVGYGTDSHLGDYWLVKNSWGESWGQQGYIWMARNRNNNCGIATSATIPTF